MVDLENKEAIQSTLQEKVLSSEYIYCDENGNLCDGVRIHPEFEKLIHPLSREELRELETSVKAKGCLDPIKVWQGYIVDGHHRHRICEENNLPYEVIDMDFDDEWDIKRWMIDNQLGRRNLTDVARIEYASLRVDIVRGIAQRNQEENQFQKTADLSKLDPKTRRHFERKKEKRKILVSAAVGSLAGVSPSTVKRYNYVKQHANQETLKALQQGNLVPFGKKGKKKKLSVDGLYRELRAKEKRDHLTPEELEEEIQKASTSSKARLDGSIDPHRKNNLNVSEHPQCGESQVKVVPREDLQVERISTRVITCPIVELSKHVEPGSIDVIITEPPCKEGGIDLFEQLGSFARHALKEGAPCVVIAGNAFLPDFTEMLRAHLEYCWTLNFNETQGVYEALGTSVEALWKPVLLFSKGKPNLKPFSDILGSIEEVVESFSYLGETICDPFCGEGAIAKACVEKGRSFIGSDADTEKTQELKGILQPKTV